MKKENSSQSISAIFQTYQEKIKGVKWWQFSKRLKIDAWLDEQIKEAQSLIKEKNHEKKDKDLTERGSSIFTNDT
ncbi:hypothetical protein [Xanthovirga aplysinae]|uniref:hypothetical protein n=1 Tax=Xanthovirga aplysinae TaxID=2529853 RepID=UPI0012BC5958|nr:hypothetical protein [Xanthovirga aplysinae]MTI29442.1 hypothetical protein [Xanthovirga aplysinae]